MSLLARFTASAPGSIGNFGPGLDVLGAAVVGAWDVVSAEWCATPGLSIADAGHPDLSTDPALHASGIAANAVLRIAAEQGHDLLRRGIRLTVSKGLPLSAGQGGSAASAVAGATATNGLIGGPLNEGQLMSACLEAEMAVAGRHLDNIAPSLLGGIVLVRSLDPMDVVQLPVPPRLRVVVAYPEQEVRTADARALLPAQVPLATTISQMANVASIVAACFSEDLALMGRAFEDHVAEPARQHMLPGFAEAKAEALSAGALAAAISGAGPTSFALCDSDVSAQRVSHAMRDAYATRGIIANVRVTRLDPRGVRLEHEVVSPL